MSLLEVAQTTNSLFSLLQIYMNQLQFEHRNNNGCGMERLIVLALSKSKKMRGKVTR